MYFTAYIQTEGRFKQRRFPHEIGLMTDVQSGEIAFGIGAAAVCLNAHVFVQQQGVFAQKVAHQHQPTAALPHIKGESGRITTLYGA
jgi:hypothetical protein